MIRLTEEQCWEKCFGIPNCVSLQQVPAYMRLTEALQKGVFGSWTGVMVFEKEWWNKINFYAELKEKQRRRDGG